MPQDVSPFDRDGAEAARRAPATRSVLIVEDHPLFAEALEMTLSGRLGVRAVRRAATLAAGLEALAGREAPPDTVLLDLGLPDAVGLDGVAKMRAAAPGALILVVTSMVDGRVAAGALAAGADGIITKEASRDRLMEALRALWSGERVAPAGLGAAISPALQAGAGGAEAARKLAALTPQQARILDLVCEGMLNKQIAFELDIAETTVKAHISAILRKLGVQSRTQAVLAARQARFDVIAPPLGPVAPAGASGPAGQG